MVILCTIDLETREVSLPAGQVIASYDHNVDVIRFQAEAIPGFSLNTSSIRIAAQGPNKARHDYAVDPSTVAIEEETGYITFDWPIPAGVTEMPIGSGFKYGDRGQLIFAVCAEIISGDTVSKAWHSDDGIITVVAHLEPEAGGGEDPSEEATNAQKIGQLQTDVAVVQREVAAVAGGTPTVVDSISDMTDTGLIYILSTDGKWYYYNGSAWTAGGTYGGTAVTDTTLSISGAPADAKAVGNVIKELQDGGYVADQQKISEKINDWLEEHPEATTTVQDGSLTLAKMNQEVTEHIKSDGLKKMWSIQTNANGNSTFYGLACSVDGLGHTLVQDYYNFLDVDNRNLGTDWLHFQHDDYHVFTITHKTETVDFYIAITKDFENWTHGTVNIGLSTASGYADPYVWTPQIFEFRNKLYIGATVQEGAPVDNGDIYGITLLRRSAIYIAEITLDYETSSVTRVSAFTRVSFGEIHDKSGNSYDVSGNAMDAWFVPNGDKLFCVFNERYMQEIHTAVANNISDTFTILAENIFDMPYTEAPTVLQINDNLWKISACLWNTAFSAEEENLCCYTSDFETFFHRGVMERINVVQANKLYTGRMRNPSFFYMTYEQEHDFCKNHQVHTDGYVHEFKPAKKTFSEGYKSVLNHTNVNIQPNVAFKSLSGSAITLSDNFSDVTLTDLVFLKSGDVVTLICQLGNVKLVSGQNIIGEIHEMFRPSFTIHFVAYAGTGTTLGTAIRGDITPTGLLRLYSGSSWSGYNSIRGECCYLSV